MTLVALAPGKVNLCLFVGRTRSDGLHPLVSIVQSVSLADELCLDLAPAGTRGDLVECPQVPGENLAARALAAYREVTGWDGPPLRLQIAKRVPVAAGMGGGSGDAAAALRLIARAANGGDDHLEAIAPTLGADVPAQLKPGRTFVTGAGEHVEPLPPLAPPHAYAILPSPHGLSTPDVFREADRLGLPRPDDELAELARRVRAGDTPLVNDLEPAARSLCPTIAAALADLRAAGADGAMVSGSGPAVFGAFDTHEQAGAAAAELRARHPGAFAATPVDAEFGAVREA